MFLLDAGLPTEIVLVKNRCLTVRIPFCTLQLSYLHTQAKPHDPLDLTDMSVQFQLVAYQKFNIPTTYT